MSLEAFGVKNLRCLVDTGMVPIRPITVLVGRNSSGKSTFLRAFPLLRQSVETPRNSPILWYHERYVDFGSLADATNEQASEPGVTFAFRIRVPQPKKGRNVLGVQPFDIAMTLAGTETPYVSGYELHVEGQTLRLTFDAGGQLHGFSVDGEPQSLEQTISLSGEAYLLPNLGLGEPSSVSYRAASDRDSRFGFPITAGLGFLSSSGSPMHFLATSDLLLADFMHRVSYVAPLRVSAQRAYRIQNLAVDEIAPDGSNLAMLLHALTPAENESLAAFTRKALGFETKIKTTGIHAEVLVKEQGAKRFANLVDVGFGYSEVLPLMAALWSSCVRPLRDRRQRPSLLALEQPELHLHPAYQAKLARMMAEAVAESQKSGEGTRLLVETHSETLINSLGKLVYEGVIKAEDVQIVLFDLDEETRQATVRLAGYRENGSLHDWPYGFLSPVAERRSPPEAAE